MSAVAPDDIHQITTMVWESVLDMAICPAGTGQPVAQVIGAQVAISGAWQGRVRITCSPLLARRLTGMLFMIEDDEVDDEQVRDALGEVVNMIGGNLKALLPQPSKLGLPEPVMAGSGVPMASVSLECDKQPLTVEISEQEAS